MPQPLLLCARNKLKKAQAKFYRQNSILRLALFLPLLFAIPHTLCAQTGITDGLMAHYPLDGNAHDESGHGNHGNVHGAIPTTDRFGNPQGAYQFDGRSWIEVPSAPQLNRLNALTISAWINPDGLADAGYLVSKGMDNQAGWYGLVYTSTYGIFGPFSRPNRPVAMFSSRVVQRKALARPSVYSATAVNPGQWSLIAAVFDGTRMKLYVDGVLGLQLDLHGFQEANPDPLTIGRHMMEADPHFFQGKIDDVRIYNRALSDAEIQWLEQPVLVRPLFDQAKAVKGGATVPIKIQPRNANGINFSDPNIAVTVISLTRVSDDAHDIFQRSGQESAGGRFHYDSTLGYTGGYVYNLSTKGLAAGAYNLNLMVGNDPTHHAVRFQVQ